ncbi:hypothetical protein XM38_033750 [Halomicronema hongdechloris C2206]|uniref:Uncharacterized protein n=2 Tax=Halomicronema hongdechloris TaxID=1209493 RepID=A0A1Z3HQ44_9CYAN|nr:hypothetical protein XM38_033750 [Halomicronema hongdechloris C2206]
MLWFPGRDWSGCSVAVPCYALHDRNYAWLTSMLSIEIVIVCIIVLYIWTKEVFKPPKQKSVEEQLAEALKKYLEKGVKIRSGDDKSS